MVWLQRRERPSSEWSAALAFSNTMFAPMGTLVVWSLLDITRTKKTTAVGAATAIVVGLVAITPAAGFVSPVSGIVLGAIAAVPSYFAILWRAGTRLDDSLDVIAAHGVGGTVGALLTGVLAQKIWNGTAERRCSATETARHPIRGSTRHHRL
jgi:Amt family ammonium transporter